jgi:hypothetical protein
LTLSNLHVTADLRRQLCLIHLALQPQIGDLADDSELTLEFVVRASNLGSFVWSAKTAA